MKIKFKSLPTRFKFKAKPVISDTDHDHNYCLPDQMKLKKKNDFLRKQCENFQRKAKNASEKARCLKKKIVAMRELVIELRKEQLVSSNVESVLSEKFSGH